MNLGEMIDLAIAQVIPLTKQEELVNTNKVFMKGMINKAYHRIERAALWKFSEGEADISVVANTRECPDAPSDFGISIAVYSPELKQELQFHDERQSFLDIGWQGGPVQLYSLWDGDLKFYPLPKKNETLTLRYYKFWSDLDADSDVPIFPATWHDLLVDFASGQLALRLPAPGERFLPNSKAEPWIQSFEVRLLEMTQSDLVLPTWDEVPNYGFQENVLGISEW